MCFVVGGGGGSLFCVLLGRGFSIFCFLYGGMGGGSLFCFVREGVLYFVFCRVGVGVGGTLYFVSCWIQNCLEKLVMMKMQYTTSRLKT